MLSNGGSRLASCVKIIDLSGNDLCGDPEVLIMLSYLPNLISLDLSNSYGAKQGPKSVRNFQVCQKSNITLGITLPEKLVNLRFSPKNVGTALRKLILSNNRFSTVPIDVTTVPHLCQLDLSFNSLTVLSSTEMKQLDDLATQNNFSLNLDGNLLTCGCKTLDFIMWLFKSKVQLQKRNHQCVRDDGSVVNTTYIFEHHDEEWRRCSGTFWLYISIILAVIFLLAMGIVSMINQRKTLLVNIILRMFGFKTVKKALTRNDFPNDAYIGYSDSDYQYICHTVRAHLEDQSGLKLFLKHRDTIPGGQIADDIIDGIDSSWKMVLIITSPFLEDQWCRFIVNRVVYSSSRMPAGSIVLVLFEDVRRGDIPPTLLNVVEERYIFSVGRYRGDEGRLWVEVSQCLKT
ncbi:LOW QUALITY PROTEIN: toll-like receptor 4 [Haliotis rubra]|uniref:LOW QUALITY PROTEIN: toll-like receptor 4 n=1 Tax=Haliotis rubra TaxID=36100 RepID=UPI001EE59FAA|nr:LOW QUALITY PROTEIN: toll-like receptor 4 [Haliotis rubra]